MTANEGDDPATAETPLYGDEEAERASGVPLPSLRVLQAAGAIRSHKVAKEHGGYRRMWSEMDVLKASHCRRARRALRLEHPPRRRGDWPRFIRLSGRS